MAVAIRRTLTHETTLSGVGLHSGRLVHMRLLPANAGTGVVFVRTDLPGAPRLTVGDWHPNCPPFRTALKRDQCEVHTVEHLLAAVLGLGLTDLEVQLDGIEAPGLDGSALPFAEALQAGGPVDLPGSEIAVHVVAREDDFEESGARIQVLPWPEGLKITYTLHYPDEPLAQGTASFVITPETFLKELAPARTFCLRREAAALLAAGFGKGAGTHNTLVLDSGSVLQQSMRFPDEPVRHKVLDLLGDLGLLKRPVYGHIVAERSGHRLNRVLVHWLAHQEG